MEKQLTFYILQELKEKKFLEQGLLGGNMGICLSLYLLSNHGSYSEAEETADQLLDKVTASIPTMKDLSLDRGLTGIGLAINYLHVNDYITGDIDDILYDIDAMLYRFLCKEDSYASTEWTNGYLGYLLYIIARLKNPSHQKESVLNLIDENILAQIVNILYRKMPNEFNLLSKELHASLTWKFPILFYCFRQILNLDICSDQIKDIMNEWLFYICGNIPYYNINRLALANSLFFLNEKLESRKISAYVTMLRESIDVNEIFYEFEYEINSINGGWLYCLFCIAIACEENSGHQEIELKNKILNNFYKDFLLQLNNQHNSDHDITFMKGLSGIAFVHKVFPQMFTICNEANDKKK